MRQTFIDANARIIDQTGRNEKGANKKYLKIKKKAQQCKMCRYLYIDLLFGNDELPLPRVMPSSCLLFINYIAYAA